MPIGKYIVDFVCRKKKIIIEIDGSQHWTKEGRESDRIRDAYLRENGFHIIRFNSVEVLNNTDNVIDVIYQNLKNPLKSP
jgi:5-methyltetrahydrofolate--homocysteine methyltransferase